MKRPAHYITSLLMTAIYLLVILAPLAPAALHSGTSTRVLAGACAGDCRSCGCSPERSAVHACCCWQKKLAEAKSLRQAAEHKSCPPSTAAVSSEATGSCCSKSTSHADHEDEAASATQANATTDTAAPVSISTCPCGSGKDLLFAAGEEIQHIPCRYLSGVPNQAVTLFAFLQAELLATRSDQPPDPPPKIYILS